MPADEVTQAEKAGAAPYSRALLSVYDTVVLRWSNTLVWRCPSERLLAHYNSHVGGRHLDIGPGSGWYLRRAIYPTLNPMVVLLDLNPNTLQITTARLADRGITAATHTGSILGRLPADIGVFDSVAANFVLHCVPGTWVEKGRAFGHIAQVMTEDGVFFGSTILDTGVHHTPLSRALNSLYNGPIKLFHNRGDDLDGLHTALAAAFGEVEITIVGSVAVFAARLPRRPGG
ncbi:putative methyltransferase [Rhodococcus opacus M213]|uniref:Putative methyltransferase n=1 Tax=Rhodococcus opacus M213 TaxID=1129896 RepID=K8XPX1_RHOOP|nr:class I SAM-dependent methyltransferase [Rhodococcus opacus]EKT79085.1 putative methyltransferase [Rhodococcus opacus M213]